MINSFLEVTRWQKALVVVASARVPDYLPGAVRGDLEPVAPRALPLGRLRIVVAQQLAGSLFRDRQDSGAVLWGLVYQREHQSGLAEDPDRVNIHRSVVRLRKWCGSDLPQEFNRHDTSFKKLRQAE
jgi:hypothetical protein